MQTLEPLGPSAELARAYANLACERMLGDGGMRRRSSWPCGPRPSPSRWASPKCSATRSTPRAARGPAWARSGPASWSGRWTSRVSGRLPEQAGRAFTNIYSHPLRSPAVHRGRAVLRPRRGLLRRARHHHLRELPALRADHRPGADRTLGEAAALSRELLNRGEASPVNRLGPAQPARRDPGPPGRAWGLGASRRGDAAYADGTGEPQHIVPVRLARAEAFWLEGNLDGGRPRGRAGRRRRRPAATPGIVARWRSGCGAPGRSRAPRGDLAEPYQQPDRR